MSRSGHSPKEALTQPSGNWPATSGAWLPSFLEKAIGGAPDSCPRSLSSPEGKKQRTKPLASIFFGRNRIFIVASSPRPTESPLVGRRPSPRASYISCTESRESGLYGDNGLRGSDPAA